MRRLRIATGIFLAVLIAFGGIVANAQQANQPGSIRIRNDEAGFAKMAKISIQPAIHAALKQFPGKVLKAGLENESGFCFFI